MILQSLGQIRTLPSPHTHAGTLGPDTLTFIQATPGGESYAVGGAYLTPTQAAALAAQIRSRASGDTDTTFGVIRTDYRPHDVTETFAVRGAFTLTLHLPIAPGPLGQARSLELPLLGFDDAFDHAELIARQLETTESNSLYGQLIGGVGGMLRLGRTGLNLSADFGRENGLPAHVLFQALRACQGTPDDAAPNSRVPNLAYAEITSELLGYAEYAPVITLSSGLRMIVEHADLRLYLGSEVEYEAAERRAAETNALIRR